MPTFIKREQISVVDIKIVDHLDAYTAPRLVEYFDPDPCEARIMALAMSNIPVPTAAMPRPPAPQYRGVKVEAQYDVAEYDVSILSAEESDGLVRLLTDNGYRIPAGAEPVIGSYIKQKMHFFVAKVNLKRLQQSGAAYLRPLQVRYETAKFMLPLRLGTVNANGPQDLIVYALTKKGRVEASNYRTVKVPSDVDVPLFVKDDFTNFYKATFEHAVAREGMHGVFVEYAWDMGWCDPCAAEPLGKGELVELGALWDDGGDPVANRFSSRQCAVRDAAARALRRAELPRGYQFHRDRRPREFPGPLHPAPSGERDRSLRGGQGLPRLAAGAVQGAGRQSGQSHRLVERRYRQAHGGRRPGYFARAVMRMITPKRARRLAWP